MVLKHKPERLKFLRLPRVLAELLHQKFNICTTYDLYNGAQKHEEFVGF